jgi:hypothetical protein
MLPDRVIGEREKCSRYDEILFSSEEGVVAMVLQPLCGEGGMGARLTGTDIR